MALAEARADHNLSHAAVAVAAGIHPGSLAHYMALKQPLKVTQMQALAAVLEREPSELFPDYTERGAAEARDPVNDEGAPRTTRPVTTSASTAEHAQE